MPAQSPSPATRPLATTTSSSTTETKPTCVRPLEHGARRRPGAPAPARRWRASRGRPSRSPTTVGADGGSSRRTAREAWATEASWSSESASPGRAVTPAGVLEPVAGVGADDDLRPGRQAVPGVERDRPRRPPSSNGTPGSPTAITELARALKPPDARSSQSPSCSVCTAGQDALDSRQACSALTRIRGDGRGGTGLPETMSASAISVRVPSSARTVVHRRRPGLQHPEQVGHRGAAGRPGPAGQHPADDHAQADAVRPEAGGQCSWARGLSSCGAGFGARCDRRDTRLWRTTTAALSGGTR